MTDPALIRRMNLLIIGQSHVGAIRAAAAAQRAAVPNGYRTRVIHTLEDRYGGELEESKGETQFSSALAEAIRDQIDRNAPRIVSVIGGNAHNALSLLRHARPFDFRLAGDDTLPLDPGAELIPEALVRAALEDRLQRDLLRLALLRRLAGPYIHVESPPPLRESDYIAAHADAYFQRKDGSVDVAGPGLRYRMWRLSAQIIRATVEALGCRTMAVPGEARDDAGFLKLDFAGDATHGNARYGELLIRALEA